MLSGMVPPSENVVLVIWNLCFRFAGLLVCGWSCAQAIGSKANRQIATLERAMLDFMFPPSHSRKWQHWFFVWATRKSVEPEFPFWTRIRHHSTPVSHVRDTVKRFFI